MWDLGENLQPGKRAGSPPYEQALSQETNLSYVAMVYIVYN